MSRNTKIILAVVAGVLVVLCLCVGAVVLAASLFVINTSVTTVWNPPAGLDGMVQGALVSATAGGLLALSR